MVRQKPDMYLWEIHQKMMDKYGVSVSIQTLHRELTQKLKISWKRANKQMAKRDNEERLRWMEEYLRYPAKYFVFTGELTMSRWPLTLRILTLTD